MTDVKIFLYVLVLTQGYTVLPIYKKWFDKFYRSWKEGVPKKLGWVIFLLRDVSKTSVFVSAKQDSLRNMIGADYLPESKDNCFWVTIKSLFVVLETSLVVVM